MEKFKLAVYIVLGVAAVLFILIRLGVFAGKRPDNLGVQAGRLAPCPASPNCASSQAEDAEHRISPLPLTGSASEAQARLVAILEGLPRCRVVVAEPAYLRAECRSFTFGFVDDVEFYIDEAAGLIQFRSAARVGYSDMGVNRARIEEVARALAAGQ